MDVFGVHITQQDLLKVLPGLLAAVTAAMRVIPNIATSARGRRARHSERRSPLRVAQYASAPPFSDLFSRRYDPAPDDSDARAARDVMRDQTMRFCAGGALLVLALTSAYLLYGSRFRSLPAWSLLVALFLGLGLDVVLLRTYLAVRGDPERASAAKTQEGQVLVIGEEADVRQHSLAALADMGARLVHVEGPRVLAATGVSFGRDLWKGEVIWVTVTNESAGHVRVVIRSTKTDFISRSRSRRNVLAFLESWVSFPAEPRATAEP